MKRFLALALCAVMLLSNVIISTPSVSAATVDSYIASCTTYPANLTVRTTKDTTMMSHPCTSATDSSSVPTHIIKDGTLLNVSALYKNTAGEYWYKVDRYGTVAYINGADTTLVEHLTGDITAEDMLCPGSLYDGQTFPIGGVISSTVNKLGKITASMYWGVDLTIDPVISASDTATNNTYNLTSSTIDYNMSFGSLATGVYTYTVSAEAISYYVDDNGQLAESVKDLIVERHRCVITDYTNPNEINGWGVDVSVWNGYIDWSKAKNDLDFAILRSSFEETTDNRFVEYATACDKYGIPFGIYVYSYAETVAEAEAEARYAVNLVKDYEMMQLPIFFDAEDPVLDALTTAELQAVTKAFIDVVRESGYEAGIYTGISWFNGYYNTPYFHSVAKWLVQIDGFYGGYTNSYNGGVHVWQYNWEGSCSGITGGLDVNYYYDLLPGQTNDTTYRTQCTAYDSHLLVSTNSSVTMMKYPCNSSTNSTSTSVKTVAAGTDLVVTALYKNTAGEYWYQVDGGYIPANKTTVKEFLYDDVGMYNPDMGSNIDQGSFYYVRGWVSSQYNALKNVNAKVYSGEDTEVSAKISGSDTATKNEYSLYLSDVDRGLSFGNLSAGYYTYEVSAEVTNYYINSSGALASKDENVVVYTQPFTVAGTAHSHSNVSTPAVAATCTSDGMSASTYCSVCGRISSGGKIIPMLGHNYTVTTIPGNCQTHECQYKVCKNCGEETYTYAEDMFSDWSATKPNVDDKLIQTKTQYRTAELKTSSSASLSGYTMIRSDWGAGISGSVVYAPDIASTGFSTSSSLYSQYNKSKVSASETDSKKVVINSDSKTGYLYYHWCYADSYYSVESSSGSYTTFHAYYDTTDPSNYTCDTSDMSYKTSSSNCSNSEWWFVTDVYTQTYTTYNKVYIHQGAWSAWSDTAATASDSLKVEERTVYRYVDAPYGDHNYVNGVCTICGDTQSGTTPTTPTTPAAKDYYLIGYINGADYGCEGDYANMGNYKFVNGKLTATFTEDSYVFLKTTGNADWYMTKSYVTGTTGTFYNTSTGSSEKMKVPGGVEVTFTLTENADGSLTLSYTTASAPAPAVSITGKTFSLSFEDEILVNFYYTVSDATNVAETGMLVYYTKPASANISGADETYNGSFYNSSTGYYLNTTKGIAAKQMGDTRYYAAYAKMSDGTYVYSNLYEYSPKKYALSRLANSTSDQMKALCVAMLNYGAEAQNYFNYKTDDLMNASLTAEQKALVVDYSADLFRGAISADANKTTNFAKTATGFSSRSATVSFEGAFAINYYFTPNCEPDGDITFYYWSATDYANASNLAVANATGKMTMVKSADGSYWAQVTGIAAKQLDDTYYVAAVYTSNLERCCTGIVAYSLSKYCISKADGTSNMKDLAADTAVYGYHAKAYFQSVGQ